LLATLLIGVWLGWNIYTNELYTEIFRVIARGVSVTAFVTCVAFSAASVIGLLLAVAVLSSSTLLRQCARFYIEVVRGIPMLVLLFYIAFVGAPGFVALWNSSAEFLSPSGIPPSLQKYFGPVFNRLTAAKLRRRKP